jgi:hypothetical protein
MGALTMPYPAVNFARAELFFNAKGKPFSNILWWTTLSAFPGSWDIAAAAAAFSFATGGNIINSMDAAVTYLGCNFLIHNAGLARSIDTYENSSGGISGTGHLLPDDVAVVVSRLTTTPGKSGRGRLYFAGLNSDMVDNNRLNAGGITQWTSVAAQLKLPVVNQTMTWSPANLSRKTTQFHAAVDFILEPVLGTRRDRKPRR